MLWALGLMAAAIGLASWQRLGLAGTLAIATLRTILQLFVVGYILATIFAWRQPLAIVALLLVMLTVAAAVARNRIGNYSGLLLQLWLALLVSLTVTLAYSTLVVIRPETWYEPRYVIPLAGIVLGNAMTAAAITGDRLASALTQNRVAIETHLSLGATPTQAIARYQREAVKAGLIPTVNAMMIVGIVKLPGIITGQILSGTDPLDAALYQMLIMFMLAFADVLTGILVTRSLSRRFFNAAAQLVLP
mgnify:CR=1 FL=1